MERIVRFTFILALFISYQAQAEVLLVPSQPTGGADSEGYPVSRFGDAPADPMHGYQADWPAQFHHADRAPAGMVFDDAQGQADQAQHGGGNPGAGRSTAGVPADTATDPTDDAAVRRRLAARAQARQDMASSNSAGGTSTHRESQDLAVPKSPSQAAPMDLVPDRTKGVQEISVIAGDLGFFPKTFFVSRDVPVRLFVTGASKKPLCIMMDSFQVRRQVSSQKIEEITFTPNVPGQYRFYCPMNGMEGTMVVKELASSGE